MFKFGFELEGFYQQDGDIAIPPSDYPTDGFPGLVEFRSSGYKDLFAAYADVVVQSLKFLNVDCETHVHTFTSAERAILRRRWNVKAEADIQNLYGKTPKLLGNKTIASLQINISELLSEGRTDDKGVYHMPRFGLVDVPRVVRALDEAFRDDIKVANRQPGEYCIKDKVRLEYRSLPNFSFRIDDAHEAREFLDKIENALK